MADLCRKIFSCCGSTSLSPLALPTTTWPSCYTGNVSDANCISSSQAAPRSTTIMSWQIRRGKLSPISSTTSRMYCTPNASKPALPLQDVRRRSNLYAPADHVARQRGETDFFSGEPLAALSTLVYSQNIDLQRSASLTFAEITERGRVEMLGTLKMLGTDELDCRCQTGGQSDPRAHPIPSRKSRH